MTYFIVPTKTYILNYLSLLNLKNVRFLGQLSLISIQFNCIKMLVIRCLCAIALIQNDTPTREMIPLLVKRYP